MPTVLLTGSTGTIGRELGEALRGRDLDVVVGLRDPSRGAPEGTRAVAFDWTDPSTHASALAGVDRLFTLSPFMPESAEFVRPVIAAAKRAGVRFILDLSAFGASEDAELDGARQHARIEAAIRASGIDHAILQPTFFMDNVLTFQADALREHGAFYGASGGQATAYISSADVAAAAAAILSDPSPHLGRSYVLTGGEALTDAQVAELLSQVAGRAIRFVDLSLDEFAAALSQQGAPQWRVEGSVNLEKIKRNGWAREVSPDLPRLLGRAPERYAAFLERHAARLR